MSNSDTIRRIMSLMESAQITEAQTQGGALMLARILFDALNDAADEAGAENDGALGMGASGDEKLSAFKAAFMGGKYTIQVTQLDTSEAIQEGPETSDIWLSNVADEVFTYEGVEDLDYGTNDIKALAGTLLSQRVISTDMSPIEAGAKVAQAILQA